MNQGNTSHPLVGRRVMNRWREDYDTPERVKLMNRGTITSVLEGCNPLVYVKFDGRKDSVGMVARDLAFVELYPKEGSVVVVENTPKLYECEIGRIDGFRVLATQVRNHVTKKVRRKAKVVRAMYFNKEIK